MAANRTVASGGTAEAAKAGAGLTIPPLIKRNTLLIAGAQSTTGAGMGLLPSLGALMVFQLLGSTRLSGLAIAMLGVSRFVVAYPIGILADARGRRFALSVSLCIGIVGAVLSGVSMLVSSFPLFIFGVFIFGLAVGGGMQLRVAATDMYPPQRRAEGLGYVVTGSVGGSIGVTLVVSAAQWLGDNANVDPLAVAWLLAPVVIAPALGLVWLVRPDPKEIAANLADYYPGYSPPRPPTVAAAPTASGGSFFSLLRSYPKLTAYISSFAVQGNMSMIMVVAALVLNGHGHSLPAIALSTSIHSIGMFGFSIPIGLLADRVGRRPSLLLGLLIAGLGTPLLVATPDYWTITCGFFLVGLGWSFVNVAATALLADVSLPSERGRAIGGNDTFSGAANVVLALSAGPVLEGLGLTAIAVIGVAIMIPPLLMLARLKQPIVAA